MTRISALLLALLFLPAFPVPAYADGSASPSPAAVDLTDTGDDTDGDEDTDGDGEAEDGDAGDGYELVEPESVTAFSGDASDAAALLRGEDRPALTAAFAGKLENPATEDYARCILRLTAGFPVYGPLSFTECKEVPMMTEGMVLPLDCKFNLHGFVTSDAPITSVTTTITHNERNSGMYPYTKTVTFEPADNITCYDINEVNTNEKKSLNNLTRIDNLRAGPQTLSITATTTEQTEPIELVHVGFTLEKTKWVQLTRNAFADNYSKVLEFFGGDPEKFLFKFKWKGTRRNISIDPEWRAKYLTKVRWGNVHVDAAPYFRKVEDYVDTVYLNVNCGKRSSGVILLKDLISKNDGTNVTRFMSSRKYISHHSLGTVVDLNTDMGINSQRVKNKRRIYDEVKNYLTYNGVQTDDKGRQYYDFTYTGTYNRKLEGVPFTVVNYLLYELAFYRAGFRWGYYFGESSDAMHFTLTETDYSLFDHGAYAMRKVFEYIPTDGVIEGRAEPEVTPELSASPSTDASAPPSASPLLSPSASPQT